MKKTILLLLTIIISLGTTAQVAINTSGESATASAILDISSTSKGILIPRLSSNERIAIDSPANGLMVYDTETDSYWYYDIGNSGWIEIITSASSNINNLTDGRSDGTNLFIGDGAGFNDDGNNSNTGIGIASLQSNTLGNYNTAMGIASLLFNTEGSRNTAFGAYSLYINTTGEYNVASGAYSLFTNSTGSNNVGNGVSSLSSNETGSGNTAIGAYSLNTNKSSYNTGIGAFANYFNATGSNNTIIGYEAGKGTSTHNKSGNIFLGYKAGYNEIGDNKLYIENSNSDTPLIGGDFEHDSLFFNGVIRITGGSPGVDKILTSDEDGNSTWQTPQWGASTLNDLSDANTVFYNLFIGENAGQISSAASYYNTGIGLEAMEENTTGICNTALGSLSLKKNETGSFNIAIGIESANKNTTGQANTTIGTSTNDNNQTGDNNTIIGHEAGKGTSLHSKSGNIFLGYKAGYNEVGDNKLYIENSNSASPLIGGDFENDSLFFNGVVRITGGLPGTDKILTSDEDGNATWEDNAAATNINQLSDGKSDGVNVFLGFGAGGSDNGNNKNTGIGHFSLYDNTSGENNTSTGYMALSSNTTSDFNSAFGSKSLEVNTGQRNTAIGYYSMHSNTTGNYNTSVGYRTGYANQTGSNNTFVGYNARMDNSTAKSNSTAIGNETVITASNQIRLGNNSVTSIGGYVAWTNLSSKSSKSNITESTIGLDFILKLRPVSYNIGNGKSKMQNGFIALEVENTAKEMSIEFSGIDAPKNETDIYGIRYAEFVVPLVKAVQEMNSNYKQQISNLSKENIELKNRLDRLEKIIENIK